MFVCNDKKLMKYNFNLRIGSCFNSYPAANRKSDHRENVSEIDAKHHWNVFRQFIGNDPFYNISAHMAAVIKSARRIPYFFSITINGIFRSASVSPA